MKGTEAAIVPDVIPSEPFRQQRLFMQRVIKIRRRKYPSLQVRSLIL